jgi:hypothetical protein
MTCLLVKITWILSGPSDFFFAATLVPEKQKSLELLNKSVDVMKFQNITTNLAE